MASAGFVVPRQVRTITAVRAVAFGFCFLVIGLHAWEKDLPLALWIGLVAHFLVYPRIISLRAARGPDPLRREMQHLYADALLLGIWVAALGFPVWISYPLVFAPALNGIINRGLVGLG